MHSKKSRRSRGNMKINIINIETIESRIILFVQQPEMAFLLFVLLQKLIKFLFSNITRMHAGASLLIVHPFFFFFFCQFSPFAGTSTV